jgi:L-histidine Nalpha-methyltransferase
MTGAHMITAPASKRLFIHGDVDDVRISSFADDVGRGLRSFPKRLPPKCFYDDLGSMLFEAITHLPEYYLTRTESALLHASAGEIIDTLGAPIALFELGSGSAAKTKHLITAALQRQTALHYRPIDISRATLLSSSQALVDEYPGLVVDAYVGDYFTYLKKATPRLTERTLALFLGSNIGNFEPEDATGLLRALRRTLKTGDALLLGTDLKKSVDRLELAYDDPAGVTAAFNKNVLGRINRELGGNFDLHKFEHVARYDAARGAVDMFLAAKRATDAHISDLDLYVSFTEGESIHTESSYKYDRENIALIAADSGYKLDRSWMDPAEDYALSLLSVA